MKPVDIMASFIFAVSWSITRSHQQADSRTCQASIWFQFLAFGWNMRSVAEVLQVEVYAVVSMNLATTRPYPTKTGGISHGRVRRKKDGGCPNRGRSRALAMTVMPNDGTTAMAVRE
ncbi:hypothetical protein BHE74_00004397, partial [Ensete ventricosum]